MWGERGGNYNGTDAASYCNCSERKREVMAKQGHVKDERKKLTRRPGDPVKQSLV
jgi:hypothetical protein